MSRTMQVVVSKPWRVLLVEHDVRFQFSMRDAIVTSTVCELAAVCSSCLEALRIIERTPVDIALVSLRLADGSGRDVVEAVKHFQPKSEVLVMVTADDKEDIFSSLEAGASGCLLKKDLGGAGRPFIASGVDPIVSQILGNRLYAAAGQMNGPMDGLSPMQTDILCCLADGLSNKEIARRLLLSSYNVDYHLKRLRKRFAVHNRVQLVGAARALIGRA